MYSNESSDGFSRGSRRLGLCNQGWTMAPNLVTRDHSSLFSPSLQPTERTEPSPFITPSSDANEDATLGQFIPIHYHYQMLDQQARIGGFDGAINHVVKPGMKVLELGVRTGVL